MLKTDPVQYFVRRPKKTSHTEENRHCASVRSDFRNILSHTQQNGHCAFVRMCDPYRGSVRRGTRAAATLLPGGVA